uniref:Uncharacterized protein n=1 Tax=Panagrolaimus sp. JU765 TaxID=591449 RepID=A0AC34QNQ8_9BILA
MQKIAEFQAETQENEETQSGESLVGILLNKFGQLALENSKDLSERTSNCFSPRISAEFQENKYTPKVSKFRQFFEQLSRQNSLTETSSLKLQTSKWKDWNYKKPQEMRQSSETCVVPKTMSTVAVQTGVSIRRTRSESRIPTLIASPPCVQKYIQKRKEKLVKTDSSKAKGTPQSAKINFLLSTLEKTTPLQDGPKYASNIIISGRRLRTPGSGKDCRMKPVENPDSETPKMTYRYLRDTVSSRTRTAMKTRISPSKTNIFE